MNFLVSLTIQIAILIGIIAISIGSLNFFLREEFVVHRNGVVLITGTSSGIGRNASFELAELGYVVFCGVRKEKDIESLNKEAKEKGVTKNIVPIIMDVLNSKHIASSLETVTKYLDSTGLPLAGIVNNAGVAFRLPVEVAPLGEVKSLFNVNYFSTIEVTQTFLPLIRKYKGRIVFISSVAGIVTQYGAGFYSGTKKAMEAMVDALRLEMYPFGVSVSSILPGYIKTDIVDNVRTYLDYNIPEEKLEVYRKNLEFMKIQRKLVFEDAVSTKVTSEVIIHALSDPFPKTRYFVGPVNKLMSAGTLSILLGFLPDRLGDRSNRIN
jgi:short-subunit dehydrogenase